MTSGASKKVSPEARKQINTFMKFLDGMKFDIDHPAFPKAIEFLRTIPGEFTTYDINKMREKVCRAFQIQDSELDHILARDEEIDKVDDDKPVSIFGDYNIVEAEKELMTLVPPEGYLPDYLGAVRNTEPPLAYHVFNALLAASVVLGGRVWIDMGIYQLFPPLAVMILGPSGIIKTKSADFAVGLLLDLEAVTVYSEIATPQGLALEMSDSPQGLIYAPELTAFLTREKFMDGMVTFITRALDHPRPVLDKKTVGGGRVVIKEPCASMLTCSTLDWLVEKTPEGTFGGGFMARQILVMQDDSPRIVPRPTINKELKTKTLMHLASLQDYVGEFKFTKEADDYYDHWYREHKPLWKNPEVELMSTIYRRRTDNVQRVALILHLSHCSTGEVCLDCFKRAAGLLEWTDKFTIPALKKVFKTGAGKDQEIVLRTMKALGGVVEHSVLVRKLQYRMNARQMKVVIESLKDARQVDEKHRGIQHTYFLL